MQLVESDAFGTVQCDFWGDDHNDIWVTREQIGRALEYSEPRLAITKIHDRHADRLNKFSRVTNLVLPKGGKQNTTIYNAKGVYEICRWSRQPKADVFMDWVWDVIESIRKTASHSVSNDQLTVSDRVKVGIAVSKCTKYTLPYVLDIFKPFLTIARKEFGVKFTPNDEPNESVKTFLNGHEILNLPTSEVYEAYVEFCNKEGFDCINNIMFSKKVKSITDVTICDKKTNGKKQRIFRGR